MGKKIITKEKKINIFSWSTNYMGILNLGKWFIRQRNYQANWY